MTPFFELLDSKHHSDGLVDNFQCNDEIIVSNFLKEESFRYHLTDSAKTHLCISDNNELLGYFTLYNDTIEVTKSKQKKHRWSNLPNVTLYPAIRIHFLGVDERYRKQGLGEAILMEALKHCEEVSRVVGCIFVTVEALKRSVGFYERYAFKLIQEYRDYDLMILKIDELR